MFISAEKAASGGGWEKAEDRELLYFRKGGAGGALARCLSASQRDTGIVLKQS